MSTDEVKGRIEKAAGDLKDDDDLKREGQIDQVIGNIKKRADDVGDKVKDAATSDDDGASGASRGRPCGRLPRSPT
jgi:uncharacterized protein YjbJ (UPF0337 family)